MKTETKLKAIEKTVDHLGYTFTEQQLHELIGHVDTHEYFLGEEIPFKFSWNEALFSWYENIFSMIVMEADNKRLQWWTGMTKEKLFFTLSHEWYMKSVYNDDFEPWPHQVARDVAKRYSRFPKFFSKLFYWAVV